MAKKTLNDKIKIAVAAFIFFSCLYFVVAIWLKTDGIKFDPESVYELLKDTVTLAGAFFAPVVALILFVDWREPHLAIKNDIFFDEIIKDIVNIKRELTSEKNYVVGNSILDLNLRTEEEQSIKLLKIRNDINELTTKLESREINEYIEYKKLLNFFRSEAEKLCNLLTKYSCIKNTDTHEIINVWCLIDILTQMIKDSRPTI